ncbi:uncharacterized protein Tco025E_06868 [Trypanosoma conorhini]|uniref:Clu domain-containing protein n=1 Tax=Trypanosoma conorhini TaxID=83891 RepID=A0A422NXJ9_9TRYP|nr:uncharacterized protein Tco025E_06868 [Trypanosoma conorhini]RNF10139.1 hypothetical protein Tco025E_06868 [Trypanosoma conorhini]
MEDSTISQAEVRMEQLRRVEREFVAEATYTVKQIVMLDDDGPRELPKFLQCYRVDNIFFRVLPDSRSGRNYVASLRGVLQSRTSLLAVPLSCMFFFRGMPVLAQALVPMPREPTRLYGADSTNNQEVEAEILHMAEALNIPLPNSIVCEVYEGLDARWYCTLTNITTIDVAEGFSASPPLKRQEMLVFCPLVTPGPHDVFAVMRAAPVLDALAQLEGKAQADAQSHLCDVLHFYGINFCFLKEVLETFASERGTDTEAVRVLERCVAIEMLARAVKQEFYLEVQGKRVAHDSRTLQRCIASTISRALDAENFWEQFLPVLARKYNISATDASSLELFASVAVSRQHDIVARISLLIGARFCAEASSTAEQVKWLPKLQSSVVPLVSDPSTVQSLAFQYDVTKTSMTHLYAFCLPLQSKVAYWEGKLDVALSFALEVAAAEKARHGDLGLPYLYALRDVCEILLGGDDVKFISDGRKYMESLLAGFDAAAGPLTRMRRHIECACWLLAASDVLDLKAEALQHFRTAAQLAPAGLRGDLGAWLYTRPFLGMLRCAQMMRPKPSMDLAGMAGDARQLARVVTPADYFVEYLWELGMELFCEEKYELAAKMLHAAFKMRRKVPRSALDAGALMQDLVNVYRAWNPAKYGTYCDSLLKAMSEDRSRAFSWPSDSSAGNSHWP